MKKQYELIRSDRRTLSVSINGKGALVVRAPKRMPLTQIEAFLAQKERWIEQKQALVRENAPEPFVVKEGARLPYLGGALPIKLCDLRNCTLGEDCLLVPERGDALAHLRKWRKAQAARVLMPRVDMWAQRTGIHPTAVGFGQARSRWGSMTSTGSLRLNAALLHCPLELTDYVIVHELTHRLHPNHSPAFHEQVRRFLPGADSLRARLKLLSGYTTLLNHEEAP